MIPITVQEEWESRTRRDAPLDAHLGREERIFIATAIGDGCWVTARHPVRAEAIRLVEEAIRQGHSYACIDASEKARQA